jgi:tetratricopeptide (TPR) repeat protein
MFGVDVENPTIDLVIVFPFENLSESTGNGEEIPPPPGSDIPPPPGDNQSQTDPFGKTMWIRTAIQYICSSYIDRTKLFLTDDIDAMINGGKDIELFPSSGSDKIEILSKTTSQERTEIARYVGAKYIISGDYTVEEDQLVINYTVEEYDGISISTLITEKEIAGPTENLQEYCSGIVEDFIKNTPDGAITTDVRNTLDLRFTDSNLALMWASRCVGLVVTGKAISFATTAVNLDPAFAIGYKLRGDGYRYEKNFEKAIDSYKTAIELESGVSDYHYVLGISYYLLGNEKLSEVMFVDEDLKEILMGLEEFLTSYDFSIVKDSSTKEMIDEKIDKLVLEIEKAYSTTGSVFDPELPFLIDEFIGITSQEDLLYDVVDKLVEVKKEIERAGSRNKDEIPFPDEYTLAREEYNRAIEINPLYIPAMLRLAKLDEVEGKRKDAIDRLRRIIEINGRIAKAYDMLGNDLWYYAVETQSTKWKSYFREAVDAYNKSLEIQPNKATTYYNLGSLYLKLENATLAIEHFEKYLELKPDSLNADDVRDTIENLKSGKY